MDLEKFFDTVCQSKLIEVLSRTIKDGRVISLIHKYLNAGVIAKGKLLYPPAFTDKVILKPKCPQNIRKFGQFKK